MFDLEGMFTDVAETRGVRVVLYVVVGAVLVWLLSIGITADWWFVRLTRVVAALLGMAALAAFMFLQERGVAKQSCLGAAGGFFGSIGFAFAGAVVLIVGEVIDDGRG